MGRGKCVYGLYYTQASAYVHLEGADLSEDLEAVFEVVVCVVFCEERECVWVTGLLSTRFCCCFLGLIKELLLVEFGRTRILSKEVLIVLFEGFVLVK